MKKRISFVKNKFGFIWDKIKSTGKAFRREADETVIAAKILKKILTGEPITEDQIMFLKGQSIDLAKAMAIVGVQAIPGSSVAVIALEKLAQKRGFTLFSKDQSKINNDKKD